MSTDQDTVKHRIRFISYINHLNNDFYENNYLTQKWCIVIDDKFIYTKLFFFNNNEQITTVDKDL